jgi:phospholipid-transporting ATPase
MIEQDFELLGTTAIEDKLQEQVGETLEHLKAADLKLWVLTGDKVETAINIGYSSKLIDDEMELFIIDGESTQAIYGQLEKFLIAAKRAARTREVAIVVGGDQIGKITSVQKSRKILEIFLQLTSIATSILCCRVSPKQKAEIVRLIKAHDPGKTTLAIGDGANDVNMITAASIGVGISGLEG